MLCQTQAAHANMVARGRGGGGGGFSLATFFLLHLNQCFLICAWRVAILIQVQYKKEGQPTAARQGSAFEHLLSPRAKNRVINLEEQRVSASSKKLLIAMQSGHLRTPSDLCACVWIASITTRFSASQIILLVSSLDRFNVSNGPMSVLIDMGQNLGVLILNLDHLRFTPNHLFSTTFR